MSPLDAKTPVQLGGGAYADKSAEELLLGYRDQGDDGAFDALVHRFEREIFNYLYRYMSNRELAEEAFQATFLRVHEKCHQFDEGRQVRPWLYSIATTQAIDTLRREGRHTSVSLDRQMNQEDSESQLGMGTLLASDQPGPLTQVEQNEAREWTRRSVNALPIPLRTVVLLVFFQGLKYREAAAALDVPVGTVKSRMHKALMQLHAAWREHYADTHDDYDERSTNG